MNINALLVLLMHWSVAILLIIGGLSALSKGFKLIMSGKGKTKEDSNIEIFGMKAKLGSIGSVAILTAFLWGWAAVWCLPSYKDKDVTIGELQSLIASKDLELKKSNSKLQETNRELISVKQEIDKLMALYQAHAPGEKQPL
jgi:hypothetical protein